MIRRVGIAWIRLCAYVWIIALIYALYKKVVIEHWRPRVISDFLLLPIVLLLALLPFAFARMAEAMFKNRKSAAEKK